MQLRRGRVSLTNGFNTVRGVYAANLTAVVGTFIPGEQLRWGASGQGICTSHDTIASKVYFTRSSGPAPAAGDGLQNIPGTKTSTISSLASDSTPDFSTELAAPGGTPIFSVQESGVFYNVVTPLADSFSLSGNYLGDTDPESAYEIVRDFESHYGWPFPGAGDIDVASIIGQLVVRQGQTLYGPAKTAAAYAANWSDVTGLPVEHWKDADRMVHLSGAAKNTVGAVPLAALTLPAGSRPGVTRYFSTYDGHKVQISAAGVVTVITGALNVAVYFDNIHFRAEA